MPCVRSRLARMRAPSTCSPATRSRLCASAPEASRKISGSAIHSICQGPVERSWSATVGRQRVEGGGRRARREARPTLTRPFVGAAQGGQQARGLEAEGYGHRLLQFAAPGFGGVAVAPRQAGKTRRDLFHVLLDPVE